MTQEKIDRINALARKSRSEGLNDAERAEQAALRQEYRDSVTQNLTAQLDNTYIVDEHGNKRKVGKPS